MSEAEHGGAEAAGLVQSLKKSTQVLFLNRALFRQCFGDERYHQMGHFVDNQMSPILFEYCGWVDYITGDHRIKVSKKHDLTAMVVSDDGKHLYTSTKKGIILDWDLIKLEKTANQWDHSGVSINAIAWHNGMLASIDQSPSLMIVDTHHRDKSKICCNLDSMANDLCFHHSGKMIVTCSDDTTLSLWSVENVECLRQFKGHTNWVHRVMFVGDSIVSGGFDYSLRVWVEDSGVPKSVAFIKNGPINFISVNSDLTWIAHSVRDEIVLWDWPLMEQFKKHQIWDIMDLCFHPSIPHALAIARPESKLEIIDVRNGDILVCIKEKCTSERIRKIKFTPDGSRLISVWKRHRIGIYDLTLFDLFN